MVIQHGDRPVVPATWLKLSLNPLKSSGQFSRQGLQWFATQILLEGIPAHRKDPRIPLNQLDDRCEAILKSSPLLTGLNLEIEADQKRMLEILEHNQESVEWWALMAAVFLSFAKEGLDTNDAGLALWGMASAERCRAMIVFKEELEEVVFMGQSAKRLVDILRIWNSNKGNDDEGFWQITFKENSYAISQVFAVPVIFIKDGAYIGGMSVGRTSARLADYLYALESSREAAIVEIKTPATKLLGRPYRGTVSPSPDLSGAVMQALDYRDTLASNPQIIEAIVKPPRFAPRCVVIIGNGKDELNSEAKRRAFELYRANCKDVEIVTYDELFRKLEVLATLFNLTRGTRDPAAQATAPPAPAN